MAGDGPAETAEGALKPSSDLTLTDAQCVAVTIAHYQKLKRQQLDDVAGLAVGVQSRMTYQVLRRLEHEIIAGDGQAENMLGILNTTGVASVPFGATTPFADLVMLGIDAVIQSEAVPNGVIMNPSDWSSALVAKATGSGEYLSDLGPFGVQTDVLWGLPCVVTKAVPQGTALVGDFQLGATLHVREAVNLRISDADQDDFVRNQVTFLTEGRWGLAIWRPACFAIVNLK